MSLLSTTHNIPYEKVGKNEPVSIADEVQFEIPDSWELVRLSSINELYTGNSINANEKKRNFTGLTEGRYYIGTKDISFNHSIDYNNGVRIPNSYEKFRIAPQNSILMCIEGGSAGRKIAISDTDVCFGNKLCCFVSYGIDYRFLYYYLQSPIFQSTFKQNTTGIIGGVSVNVLKSMLLTVPPLDEQKRIVSKIEELMPSIEQYELSETKLSKLNDTFPEQLKKSILQYAVQGKLVPQDLNDEPADILLERIREEKKKLIKEGKIKKDKNESVIFRRDNSHYEKLNGTLRCIDDEIPFEIPENWAWTRLFDIIQLQSGQDLTPDKYNSIGDGVPYITGASNIENNSIIINRWTLYGRAFAYNGDLLLTCKGTVGEMVFLEEEKVHIARQIMSIKPLYKTNAEYIRYYLESYVEQLKSVAKSMIPGISRDDVLFALMPMPPILEQERIVAKLKDVLPAIKCL